MKRSKIAVCGGLLWACLGAVGVCVAAEGQRLKTPAVFVCVTDSATGRPLAGVSGRIPKPEYYGSLRRGRAKSWGPEAMWWYSITDSTGCMRISYEAGFRELWLDTFLYGFSQLRILGKPGRVDTIHVALPYVGRPPDGRSEETVFVFDSLAASKKSRWRPKDAGLIARLHIEVRDSSGDAVPYATVWVGGWRKYFTTEGGVLDVKELPIGKCVVQITAVGWRPQAADTVMLSEKRVARVRHTMTGEPYPVQY